MWDMETQPTWLFVVFIAWIPGIFLPSTCSGMNAPQLQLEHTLFVAFRGEDLTIACDLRKPANQSADILTCYAPSHTQIYMRNIPATKGIQSTLQLKLELKNLTISGEYYCQYKAVKKYWFLHVRDESYKDLLEPYYTQMIIMAVITSFLLVVSVVGSVYTFRGHWRNTNHVDSVKKKQNKENPEEEEDNVDGTGAQSKSFYSSLEPRPRSVYDVLNHSDVDKEPNKNKLKLKSKKSDPQKKSQLQPNIEQKDDGVFESVYENI